MDVESGEIRPAQYGEITQEIHKNSQIKSIRIQGATQLSAPGDCWTGLPGGWTKVRASTGYHYGLCAKDRTLAMCLTPRTALSWRHIRWLLSGSQERLWQAFRITRELFGESRFSRFKKLRQLPKGTRLIPYFLQDNPAAEQWEAPLERQNHPETRPYYASALPSPSLTQPWTMGDVIP